MRLKAIGLILLLGLCLSYCATTGAKEAKMYRNNLETMLGKDKQEVTAMISNWNFQVLDSWKAENPDAEYTSEVFAVIRTVFRDGRLASHKVWPNLTSTSISGGFQRMR